MHIKLTFTNTIVFFKNICLLAAMLVGSIHCIQTVRAQTGLYVPELQLFDAKMNAILAKYKVSGGQLAITYDDRLVYNRGFGFADTADKTLVQPTSIFRLASASKAITSIAIMQLFQKGRLQLDQKVIGAQGILNDTQYLNPIDARMHLITIRQLLNHSAGFNYDFNNEPLWQTYDIAIDMGLTPPVNSFEKVLEWTIKNKSLGFQPGTSASYSNFGFTLLGLVIERISGVKYENYVKDSILKPLGIIAMEEGRTLKQDKYTNEVSYYDYAGAPLYKSIFTGVPNSVPSQYGGYNWEIMTPAGGWVASASDLCKLLNAVDELPGITDILNKNTIDTMCKASLHWNAYGLGWFVSADEKYHTGGIQGTATVVRSSKSKKISYAILFNSLPQNYGPLYTDFMSLVSDEFSNIVSWPIHNLFNPTELPEFISRNNFKVYPNPASTELNIERSLEFGIASLKVFNFEGKELRCFSISDDSNSIDIKFLNPGLYILEIQDNKGNVQRVCFQKS